MRRAEDEKETKVDCQDGISIITQHAHELLAVIKARPKEGHLGGSVR